MPRPKEMTSCTWISLLPGSTWLSPGTVVVLGISEDVHGGAGSWSGVGNGAQAVVSRINGLQEVARPADVIMSGDVMGGQAAPR